MKVYHVETQESYDELMIELEEKGYKWLSGCKPTQKNYWEQNKEDSCVIISSKYITFMNIEQSKKQHPNTPIIEYKAQEEMKHKLQESAFDISAAIGTFARGTLTVEAGLQEAKSSAKKLIENIDEYFETLKPKFKGGDYVTYEGVIENKIAKIDSINEDELHGLWYEQKKGGIRQDWWLKGGHTVRHATPEEIKEYEVALNFHKHGRKPFELKEGDLIEYPGGQNIMIYHPDCFSKADFLNDGFKLIKTAEEINEWLENK